MSLFLKMATFGFPAEVLLENLLSVSMCDTDAVIPLFPHLIIQ
jgi:hypothetical protein